MCQLWTAGDGKMTASMVSGRRVGLGAHPRDCPPDSFPTPDRNTPTETENIRMSERTIRILEAAAAVVLLGLFLWWTR